MAGASLFIKAFFRRIINDFRHKELLPLKLLFFVHSSTVFVLYPYLTIHMRELGINVEETAIMSAVTPVVAIIMPPLAGMVADRIGNFKILLALFSSLGGGSALLLLLVPVGRVTVTYPPLRALTLGCDQHNWTAAGADGMPCTALDEAAERQIAVTMQACGFLCHTPNSSVPVGIEGITNFTVTFPGDPPTVYSYSLKPEKQRWMESSDPDIRAHLTQHLNERYRTSVRKLPSGETFFPAVGLARLNCSDAQCSLVPSDGDVNATSEHHRHLLVRGLAAPQWQRQQPLTVTDNATGTESTTCQDGFAQLPGGVTLTLPSGESFGNCSARCLATANRTAVCREKSEQRDMDVQLTFWLYLIIRVFIGMIGGTAFAMFEGAVIAILREHKADYGLQRIYATIGGMISSPLSGLLIDYFSRGKSYTDFRPAFYLYAALKIMSGLLILTISLEFKTPAKNVVTDVITVLKNIELLALFVVIFVLGTAWGYIESFLFWLLQDLGGSRSLMGVTITVGGIAGIPLLVLSGPIIDSIGHANVLFIGFVFYAIRLLGYSLIYNPWLCLIFEAMESVTSSLSFTAAVTYAAKLSTTTTDTSIQGLLGGLYFGVGKGAGSLVGGYMMKGIGTRPTYQVFSAMCAVVGSAYFLFNKFYLRRRPQVEGNDIIKVKTKFLDGGEKGLKAKKANVIGIETIPINKDDNKNYATGDMTQPRIMVLAQLNTTAPAASECNVNFAYEATERENEKTGEKEVVSNDGKESDSNGTGTGDTGAKNAEVPDEADSDAINKSAEAVDEEGQDKAERVPEKSAYDNPALDLEDEGHAEKDDSEHAGKGDCKDGQESKDSTTPSESKA